LHQQAIAAFGQCLDKLRVFAVIAQRMANLADGMAERFLAAGAGAPDIFEQRVARDHFTRVGAEA
jgi:hypothetical protein